ncbi:unnamed protein product [Gordionus sp. m RMFG-2023]
MLKRQIFLRISIFHSHFHFQILDGICMMPCEGAIWCTTPVPFRDWEIVIQFQIYGHGENLYGDGMALWYVKDKEEKGPVFGSRDNFTGLGIFLDTYNNYNDINDHQHPYISAQVNDGTRQYNKDKDGTDTQIAGFHTNFRGADKHPIIVISYVRNTLEVKMTYDHFKTVEKCFEVKGIHLPTGYYFGASAATGELSDNHVITSFRVFPVIVDRTGKEAEEDPSKISPYAEFFSPPRDHVSKPKHIPMTAKKLVLIIILALIGLAVLFVVGVLVFKKQEESRKRLY